jgi:hypothetical protein
MIASMATEIHAERYPKLRHGTVMRRLLETIMPIAQKRGMAHVIALREKALR